MSLRVTSAHASTAKRNMQRLPLVSTTSCHVPSLKGARNSCRAASIDEKLITRFARTESG